MAYNISVGSTNQKIKGEKQMNLATVLRYADLGNPSSVWNYRYYIMHDYQLMAVKYGIGLNAIMTEHDFERICHECDGLIITGSATNIDPRYYGMPPFEKPEPVDEYALDAKLMNFFIKEKKPIFGICGGIQALNVCLGGTLKKLDDPVGHKNGDANSHVINIKEGSFVHDVFGSTTATVNCYHGWELDKVAPALDVVARTEDGVIEAVENKEMKLFATQWHPEQSFHTGDPIENKFFENFIKCCEANR